MVIRNMFNYGRSRPFTLSRRSSGEGRYAGRSSSTPNDYSGTRGSSDAEDTSRNTYVKPHLRLLEKRG